MKIERQDVVILRRVAEQAEEVKTLLRELGFLGGNWLFESFCVSNGFAIRRTLGEGSRLFGRRFPEEHLIDLPVKSVAPVIAGSKKGSVLTPP